MTDEDRDRSVREQTKKRKDREQRPSRSERPLTESERDLVTGHARLSALTVYSTILREGQEELHRPMTSLWWSGVAAGLGISTSVLVEGMLHAKLGGHPYGELIENFGYTFGFVLVILSRLQLFTENTISVVLPLLAEFDRPTLYRTARLWGIVFLANMVGTFLTAALTLYGGTVGPETVQGILDISHHLTEYTPRETLLRGIPAGFFIAAIVWMMPSSKGFELFVIVMFTYLIALGGFTHVIAGSTEIFALILHGELGLVQGVFGSILPTLVGNIIGGTGLFAMLAYGQVSEEM